MAADDYMRSRFAAPAWCCPAHLGRVRSECPECHIAHLERRLAAADALAEAVTSGEMSNGTRCRALFPAIRQALRAYEATKEPKP